MTAAPDNAQKGAALIVVLLLVATLAFVVLAITERTAASVRRTSAATARAQMLWRMVGAETLSTVVVTKALEQEAANAFTLEHPLLATPFPVPLPEGTGYLRFADASRCFNLNSMVSEATPGAFSKNETGRKEFLALAVASGLGLNEAESLADAIVDWLDTDTSQELRGAEDGFYTGLPVPFRTGGGLFASVTELRAIRGMTREIYDQLSPFFCAYPSVQPVTLNVNLLRPDDAPLLAAVVTGLDATTARDVIAERPPGGYEDASAFWALPYLEEAEKPAEGATSRVDVTSSHLEVAVGLELDGLNMEERLLFELSTGAQPRLVRRMRGGPDR